MKLTRRGEFVVCAAFVIFALLFIIFAVPPLACLMGGTC